jgi:hypothetical protein
MKWTHDQLDELERAVLHGTRLQVFRRGTEHVLVPVELRSRFGRDVLIGRRIGTGEKEEFVLDELESFTLLGVNP